MASTTLFRRSLVNVTRSSTRASFHNSARSLVKVGDAIPSINLVENSPGNQVNLSEQIGNGKALIIGVPGAFSPACSESHVPGYINHEKVKGEGKVFVVAVNDAFVTGAWGKVLDPSGSSGFRFLADPKAEFIKALELDFDASGPFGNVRSKRFALRVEDGKVKEIHVEPDNTGVDATKAEKVLG